MGTAIGIVAIKGGVGKTTIAASLASDLANNYKKKVLLVDANFSAPNLAAHMDILAPHKTIHHVLDGKIRIESAIHEKYGVDVIPGDYVYNQELNVLKLKDKLKTIKDNYDFVIIDASPNPNEELLSTLVAADMLFMVTTPDFPTLSCSLKTAKLAKARGKNITGIIINKIRDPAYELSLNDIEKMSDIPVLARIPDDKKAIRSMFTRIPLSVYNRHTPFSRELSKLSATLARKTERPSLVRKLFSRSYRKEEVNRQLLKDELYTRMFE